MDMATFTRESTLNRKAYERLREQIRRDYAGQYVVLANGSVLGSAISFDAAKKLVNVLDELPEYYLIFHAEDEPSFDLDYDVSEWG